MTADTAPPQVVVRLPDSLVRLFPGCVAEVAVRAATVAEAIAAMDATWPGLRDRICDSTPRIRRHINVFVAGERAALETRLAPGAEGDG
jgi:molybdopterin synthase sulfur carrier subunit